MDEIFGRFMIPFFPSLANSFSYSFSPLQLLLKIKKNFLKFEVKISIERTNDHPESRDDETTMLKEASGQFCFNHINEVSNSIRLTIIE